MDKDGEEALLGKRGSKNTESWQVPASVFPGGGSVVAFPETEKIGSGEYVQTGFSSIKNFGYLSSLLAHPHPGLKVRVAAFRSAMTW